MSRSHAVLVTFGLAAAACSASPLGPAVDTARDTRSGAATGPSGAGGAAILDASVAAARDAAANTDHAQTGSPSVSLRPTRLVLDFTTVSLNGRYAPKNGGVAWVADANGKWVHTFELWFGVYYSALKAYPMAGGPDYVPNFSPLGKPLSVPPPPDVITSATLPVHRTHAAESWDLNDVNGNEVPDGNYSVVIEVVEQNPEQVYDFPFVKAGEPAQWTPADVPGLKGVKISLQ
jgi:hypothetical protein